jgi:predicted RNA-binding Zn-ribbon protein involved in translation (DUF1610 family)
MIQTTFDIQFSGDDARVDVRTNRPGRVAKDAELVAYAYYASTVIAELGIADASPSFSEDASLRVVTRFLDARKGPRVFLRVKARGKVDDDCRRVSVRALLDSLVKTREQDADQVQRLEQAAGLVDRVAVAGRGAIGSELDLALACADVASRSLPVAADAIEDFRCSECGFTAPAFRFGRRIWPADHAAIRRCPNCGSGLWSRGPHSVRRIPHDVWVAAEETRQELLRLRDADDEPRLDDEESLLGELKERFEENDWPYSEVLGLPVLVSDFAGPLGYWKFYAQVVDAQNVVLLFSVCPLRVPSDRRSEASLFLTHANHGLVAGNFELDLADGEIRYKTVLQIHDDGIDPATLKNAVRANGLAMETYLPGIGAVITGASARTALERRTNGH